MRLRQITIDRTGTTRYGQTVDHQHAMRALRSRMRARSSLAFLRSAALEALAGTTKRVSSGVALTFDDGPVPGTTDRVLDALERLGVTATFFCVGRNAKRHPALLRRIAAAGHAVGSHSLTHPHPRDVPRRRLLRDYADGRRAVEDALGAAVPLFRPPNGHLTPGSSLVVRRRHRPAWLWTVDPQDWHPAATREGVTSVAARAGQGDVVLLHDWVEQPWGPEALDRSSTVEALPEVVARIRARGLELVAVTP